MVIRMVVAHRLSTIMDANLILVLKDGEIIEQGSHKQLLSQNGAYEKLWNQQVSKPIIMEDVDNTDSEKYVDEVQTNSKLFKTVARAMVMGGSTSRSVWAFPRLVEDLLSK